MANKKASTGSTKSSTTAKASTANVTTVKAVDSTKHAAKRTSGANFTRKLTSTPVLAAALAEFVGTFLLTTVVLTQQNQPIAVLFALVGIVLIIGGLSGAHVNPIATVGSWVTKRIDSPRAVAYLVAQVLGAMLALVVLNYFIAQVNPSDASSMSQSTPSLFKTAAIPKGKEWTLLYAELIGSIVLGLAYASVSRLKRDKIVSAFTIAASYFVALVLAGTVATYVSASVVLNPAAAIAASALNLNSIWPLAVYVVTAAVGGIVGFVVYDFIRKAEQE